MADNLGKADYGPDSVPVRVLTHGKSAGPDVDYLAAASNRRLTERGLIAYLTDDTDGQYLSVADIEAAAKAAWALGAMVSTVDGMRARRDVPMGVQEMIRFPGRRVDVQRDRERARKQDVIAAASDGVRAQVVKYARSFIGVTERPPGSNSGPHITAWQRHTARGGTYLDRAPWCGIFCENVCSHFGVDTLPQWAGVAMIEDFARQGAGGFARWTTSTVGVQPGDLVVLFGRGVHVELVERIDGSAVHTIGGNTSSGPGGSQSNGGGVFARVRSLNDVHGFAVVRYGN